MRVTFASIVLNESQYLLPLLQQHYTFCDEWILVEGADRRYPPEHVTAAGLSTDATAEIVQTFPDPEQKLTFLQHGWADDKCELRNRYAERIEDGIVVVFDADEFLTHAALTWLLAQLRAFPGPGCLRIPHVHFWRHARQIIRGGYYSIPHNRAYRWRAGCRYTADHNHPQHPQHGFLHQEHYVRIDPRFVATSAGWTHPEPAWLHYGFAKEAAQIQDKNQYYVNRGEATTRPGTTRDRAAWFQPGTPAGCSVHPWRGPWPEAIPPREE